MPQNYRVRVPPVVHDTIDGEVVVINFETGNYYSESGTAAIVWQALDAGASDDAIVDALRTTYATDGHDVAGAVATFVRQLHEEGLVAPAPERAGRADAAAASAASGADGGDFTMPVLEKFTEMADLILLDPVHDVTAEGWPHIAHTDDPSR